MAKRKHSNTSRNTSQSTQQPYDHLLKALLEGQEQYVLSRLMPGVEYLELVFENRAFS